MALHIRTGLNTDGMREANAAVKEYPALLRPVIYLLGSLWSVAQSVFLVVSTFFIWILSFTAVEWIFPSAWAQLQGIFTSSCTAALVGALFALFRLVVLASNR